MKFIFESENTINRHEPDYTIDYERDIEDTNIDFGPKAVALDLLSVEEAKELPKSVRTYLTGYDVEWWLQTPSSWHKGNIMVVRWDGEIDDSGRSASYSHIYVRPALTLSNFDSSNLELYEKYIIDNLEWIYIGESRFLYNDTEVFDSFDTRSNNYKSSEIKKCLNRWLQDLQLEPLAVEEA